MGTNLVKVAKIISANIVKMPQGYRAGKTVFRDILVTKARLSALHAEAVVEALQRRGFLRFLGDPKTFAGRAARWELNTLPTYLA